MAKLELKQLRKSYDSLEVIHGIDLAIEDGSFTVLVGPSGCGKSTLLRMIAGLEDVTAGEVHLGGVRCDHLLPSARGMAMVFQSYALYPHMSVYENLRFGLVCQKTPKPEIEKRIRHAAQILRIGDLLQRRPSQLSGGQSQRVAIGRAIVKEPKAFLFDEPLSNLDAELRVGMRSEIVSLHRRLGSTMIYVTHDQVEAMTMADSIVVLRDGVLEQAGSPIDLYARPRNRFVAGFIGAPRMNFLAATVVRDGNRVTLSLGDGGDSVPLVARDVPLAAGAAVTLGIRPEHAEIGGGCVEAKVEAMEILGSETIIHAGLPGGTPFTLARRGISGARVGDKLSIRLPETFIHIFDATGTAVGATADWRNAYIA